MADERGKPNSDPLYLDRVYPEAEQIFSFAPRPLRQALGDAVFVLDTNALLVPYGTSPSNLDAIRKTYQVLLKSNRLRVPAQVAREFAKNRPERLKAAYDQLAQRQSLGLNDAHYPLLAELPEYKALQVAEETLDKELKKYRAALKDLLDRVRQWYWDDPVSEMYRSLFDAKVVIGSETDPAELAREISFRATHLVPPGYKDGDKELGQAGDLIIWKTILQIGKTERKDLVFVSGEEKSDWWHRASGRVLYPRFELLDEYRRISGGKTFHILPLADLLEHFGAAPEVVDAVREEEASLAPVKNPQAAWWPLAARASDDWLSSQGELSLDEATGYRLVKQADGSLVSVEIRLVADPMKVEAKIRKAVNGALGRGTRPYLLILMARDVRTALSVKSFVDRAVRMLRPAEDICVRLGALQGSRVLWFGKQWPKSAK